MKKSTSRKDQSPVKKKIVEEVKSLPQNLQKLNIIQLEKQTSKSFKTQKRPNLQKIQIIKQESSANQKSKINQTDNFHKIQNIVKKHFEDQIPEKYLENYTDSLIKNYQEFNKNFKEYDEKKEISDDIAQKSLLLIQEKKPQILDSLIDSLLSKDFQTANKLIQMNNQSSKSLNQKKKILSTQQESSSKIYEDELKKQNENKFQMKSYKNFSKPNKNLQSINKLGKNSKDALRIYELISKTQKIENEKNIIGRMANETDYLEKILDSFKKYKKSNPENLKKTYTIKNLHDFIESSENQIETTRALINFYDSNGKIGKDYLDNFAFKKDEWIIDDNLKKYSYSNLSNQEIIDVAYKAKNYSANVSIKDKGSTMSGSAVVYKIDHEKGMVYFLTNKHVAKKKGDMKIQLMNSDLENENFNAEVIGLSDKADIAVIAIKASKKELESIEIPKFSENSKKGEQVILVGNSCGLGSQDMSTNTTFGNINYNERNTLSYLAPSFGGNSGSGVFNAQGELIGIHESGSIDIIKDKKDNIGGAVPIKIARKIADELIQNYEKKNFLENKKNLRQKSCEKNTQNKLNSKESGQNINNKTFTQREIEKRNSYNVQEIRF